MESTVCDLVLDYLPIYNGRLVCKFNSFEFDATS